MESKEEQKASLNGFTGTEKYYSLMGNYLTDGSFYVFENGAGWLITDILSICMVKPNVKKEEFVAVKFKLNEDNITGQVVYTDGNENVLFKQNYKYTDFGKIFKEKEVTFFYTDKVLMLCSEY